MKCSNCQNEVNENDRFCSKCGTPVTLLSANASDFTYSIPIPPEENTTSDEQTYNPETHSQEVNGNIFSYKGRINRLNYAMICFVIPLVLFIGNIFMLEDYGIIYIYWGYVTYTIILCLNITKRLHDINKSGWWALPVYIFYVKSTIKDVFYIACTKIFDNPNIVIENTKDALYMNSPIFNGFNFAISVYCLIVIVLLLFKKGTKGPNRFGLDPLEK